MVEKEEKPLEREKVLKKEKTKLFSKCVSNLETNYNNIYIKNE